MNRRATRSVEYYGYALIAGIQNEKARKMAPGWIRDMYNIRTKYDARLAKGGGVRL